MATAKELITQVYVGYFDRAPDPEGLNYWVGRLNDGMSLSDIAQSFSVQPESIAKYPYLATPNVASSAAFITTVYQNLFNRAPDAEGLAYWQAELAAGKPVGSFILDVISGAVTDPDASVVANKVEVGLYWVDAAANQPGFEYNAAAAASASLVLDGVTEDDATVAAAKASADSFFGSFGFSLTHDADTVAGTAGDDIFYAPVDTVIYANGPQEVQTLQGPDVINGGEGFDTLVASLNGTTGVDVGGITNPTLTSIEKLQLTSLGNAANLDLLRSTGVEEIHNVNSRYDLFVQNIGAAVDIYLTNVRGGADTYFSYDQVEVETQNLFADSVGIPGSLATVGIYDTLGNIENFNLEVANGAYIYLEHEVIENFVLTGEGPVELVSDSAFTGLETWTSSDYDGDLLINLSGAEDLVSVETGAGDDDFWVSSNAVDGDLSVDLGEGDNVLRVIVKGSDDNVSNLDFTGGVANVQTLSLINQFGGDFFFGSDITLDLEGFDADLAVVDFVQPNGDGTYDYVGADFNGDDFNIANGPASLTVNAAYLVDIDVLDTDTIVDLVINTDDGGVDFDNLNGPSLETLTVTAVDGDIVAEIVSDDDHDVSNLTEVSLNAEFYAELDIDASTHDEADVDALTTISVVGGTGAQVYLEGDDTDAVIGVAAGFEFDLATPTAAGAYQLTLQRPGGGTNNITVNYNTGANLAETTANIAAALTAAGFIVSTPVAGTFEVSYPGTGVQPAILGITTTDPGDAITFDPVADNFAGINAVDGVGFAGLETVVIETVEGTAGAYFDDVYGAFTLDISSAEGDVVVDLEDTNVTSIVASAIDDDPAGYVDIDVYGAVIGGSSLTSVVIESAYAGEVYLGGDLGSFETLDLTGVTNYIYVNTFDAVFDGAVTYLIGSTQDGTANFDVQIDTFVGNDTRETFAFVGDDIGDVQLNGFYFSGNGTDADRDLVDISAFGITSAAQLTFSDNGGALEISSSAFDGSITVTGVTLAQANDFATFNIIFA